MGLGRVTDRVFGHEGDIGKSPLAILIVVAILGVAFALAARRPTARALVAANR